MCRQWNACGKDDPAFTRRLSPGQSLTEACEAANPGDTILIPPDFYEEMALISKPVKLVGATDTSLAGQHRNAVIFQSSGSVVLLCNARYAASDCPSFQLCCHKASTGLLAQVPPTEYQVQDVQGLCRQVCHRLRACLPQHQPGQL